MEQPAYASLVPNIAQVDVDGGVVRVSWKCPATGRSVGESTAHMVADDSVTGRVRASVKRSVVSEVVYGAARALSTVFGGTLGRIVGDAAHSAAGEINAKATGGVDYTEGSRQAAIVAAFDSVKDEFRWDERSRRFVAR